MLRLVYDDFPSVDFPDVKSAMPAVDRCYETGTGSVLYSVKPSGELLPIVATPKVVKVGAR